MQCSTKRNDIFIQQVCTITHKNGLHLTQIGYAESGHNELLSNSQATCAYGVNSTLSQ